MNQCKRRNDNILKSWRMAGFPAHGRQNDGNTITVEPKRNTNLGYGPTRALYQKRGTGPGPRLK